MRSDSPTLTASVVIPAHNAQSTLGAQLDALAMQTRARDVEVLVCDNGSSDATRTVARRYAEDGMRVEVVDASERRGPAAARNIGSVHARGRLLLFCDADDVVAPGWLTAMIDALGHADLVAGDLDGRSLNARNRASVSWEVSGDIRMPFWTRFGAGASSNLGVRSDVFDAVGGFDERLRTGEDVDFCWRVQLAGFRFHRSREAVVRSRQRDGRRAVFRQAYSYGAGSRALRVKYRLYIDADRERPSSMHDGDVGGAPAPAVARSRTRRMLRVFTPTGQANLAWRVGEALGARYGHIDPHIAPMPAE